MNLTQEQREQIVTEVKKFASDLHLTPEQQEKLQTAFQAARGKLGDYMTEHPGVSRSDIAKEVSSRRDEIRQRAVNFFNPDQLKMWDSQVAKAKQFLGQQTAS
jgi:hypothetical protein